MREVPKIGRIARREAARLKLRSPRAIGQYRSGGGNSLDQGMKGHGVNWLCQCGQKSILDRLVADHFRVLPTVWKENNQTVNQNWPCGKKLRPVRWPRRTLSQFNRHQNPLGIFRPNQP
jgi:hypothetical protein